MKEDQPVHKKLPITRNEDVEFSQEAADQDDLEAQHRSELAETRVKNNNA